ncbi:hypothetical protein SAMN05444679_12830 [Variovorax sp. CF079]|nr:hypothetical protein SAMN05444679_12830 [Variovorax sp. CF079]
MRADPPYQGSAGQDDQKCSLRIRPGAALFPVLQRPRIGSQVAGEYRTGQMEAFAQGDQLARRDRWPPVCPELHACAACACRRDALRGPRSPQKSRQRGFASSFSGLQFAFQHALERLLFVGPQVGRLILVIESEQPELRAAIPPVVDDPQAAALSLAPPGIAVSQLAQTTSAFDNVPRFRVLKTFRLDASAPGDRWTTPVSRVPLCERGMPGRRTSRARPSARPSSRRRRLLREV